jgi:hypothetical protein
MPRDGVGGGKEAALRADRAAPGDRAELLLAHARHRDSVPIARPAPSGVAVATDCRLYYDGPDGSNLINVNRSLSVGKCSILKPVE